MYAALLMLLPISFVRICQGTVITCLKLDRRLAAKSISEAMVNRRAFTCAAFPGQFRSMITTTFQALFKTL